ncbi:hypothetical protein Gogos_002306, partial [Gossypium gossypioides]|nr:hypothetical protein [Gossypium gossypioides]
NLSKCSIFNVDLWGVLDGLALIQKGRYDGILIQTNSLDVFKAIQDFSFSSSNFALIRHIHHLLLNVSSLAIQYLPRDRNKVVDYLAKMAFDMNQGLKIFDEIPREVLALSPMVQARDNTAHRFFM